jgi:hypothetical protein
MDSNNPAIPLHYTFQDVVSAQQMRSLKSKSLFLRIGAVIVVWAFIMYILPGITSGSWIPENAGNALITLVVIIIVTAIAIFIGPMIDFVTNPIWKKKLEILLTPEHLMLRLVGNEKGATLEWKDVSRMLETKHALILFAQKEQDFIIIPLADLRSAGKESLLRSLVAQHLPVKP